MRSRLSAALLVVLMLLSLCACAGTASENEILEEQQNDLSFSDAQTGDSEADDPAPDTDLVELEQVRQALIDQLEIADPLLLETEMLLDLYGISADLLSQSASFVTMAGTFPDEVILTEAVDESAAETVASALQRRLDEVLVQSKTYDAENYAAAQDCKVVQSGRFVTLVLSPKQAEMNDIIKGFLNG